MPPDDRRRAVYPGSFNPATTAHLAIAEAVRQQRGVHSVTFVVSRRALAKEHVEHPRFEHRIAMLEATAKQVEWLKVMVTEQQLLVDIAAGFDVLIMGADKWKQINDPVWYDDDPKQRDQAIADLPELAIAPRPPVEVPPEHLLRLDADHAGTSSTLARAGEIEMMVPSAQAFALETGAWIDPDRYDRWVDGVPA